MKRFVIGFGWLVAACVTVAGTGTSNEFRMDARTGVRTAAATHDFCTYGKCDQWRDLTGDRSRAA